jgi:ATP-binding protein involved in chromosome partitioning
MARFSTLVNRMADTIARALEEHLTRFIVPQTNRHLGESGTELSVKCDASHIGVGIRCGFPVDLAQEHLIASLREHVAGLELDRPVKFEISWQVGTHSVQPSLKAMPGIRNIVAVASGKGGVGKSTVTTNIALALARQGARVGILDADIYGPSQPRILNLMGQRPETEDGKTLKPLSAHGVTVMSIGFLVEERQAVAWRGPMVTSALNQMLNQTDWGEIDYLLVDMPPGTGDIQLTLAQKVPVSGAVVVTTPQDIALADARKAIDLFRKVGIPVLGVIENMAMHVCSECGHIEHVFGAEGGTRLATEFEVPLLGALPLNGAIREQTDSGTPTVVADPDGPAASAFADAALRVAGELAARGRDYGHLFPNIKVEDKA